VGSSRQRDNAHTEATLESHTHAAAAAAAAAAARACRCSRSRHKPWASAAKELAEQDAEGRQQGDRQKNKQAVGGDGRAKLRRRGGANNRRS